MDLRRLDHEDEPFVRQLLRDLAREGAARCATEAVEVDVESTVGQRIEELIGEILGIRAPVAEKDPEAISSDSRRAENIGYENLDRAWIEEGPETILWRGEDRPHVGSSGWYGQHRAVLACEPLIDQILYPA